MCSVDECEVDRGIGTAGVCFNSTCLCPEGFSGRDDWSTYSSCQVSTSVANVFHLIGLAISGFNVLVMLFSMFWYSSREGFTPDSAEVIRRASKLRRGSKNPSANEQSSATPPTTPRLGLLKPPKRTSIVNANPHVVRRNWRRKRGSLIALLNFFLFAVFSVFYYIPFFLSNSETDDGYRRSDFAVRENRTPWMYVQNLSLACAGSLLFGGFFNSLIAWYDTLPSVRRYGASLNMNSLLVRYPNLVYTVARGFSLGGYLSLFLLAFIIPLAAPELQDDCDKGMIWVFLILVVAYELLLNLVVVSVRAILKEYLRNLDLDTGTAGRGQMKRDTFLAFRNGVRNASLYIYGSNVAGLVALGVFIPALLPVAESYLYISFNTLVILAQVAAMVIVLFSAFFTSGGGAPLQKRRAPVNLNSPQTDRMLPENIESVGLRISIQSDHIGTMDESEARVRHDFTL